MSAAGEIGALLRSQDNRATAHPIFVVQQRRRIYGVDPAYTEAFLWLRGPDYDEVEPLLSASLEAGFRAAQPAPDDYERVGYIDLWEFVTACLTERGAQDYIRLDGHNLREPRIYAASGYRNEEVIALRELLLGLASLEATA